MNLKAGVNFDGISPHILKACSDIHSIMDMTGQFTVTAALDGKHMKGSLHYEGRAIDIRSKHIPSQAAKHNALEALKAKLGPDFDCILENEGLEQEHFHIEYDPKG